MKYAGIVAGIGIGAAGTALAGSVLGSSLFRDIPAGAPYDRAVGNMVHANIMEGFDDGTFRPDEYVTRGQLALALDQLLRSTGKSTQRREAVVRKNGKPAASASSQSAMTKQDLEEGAGTFRFATAGFSIIEKARSITISVQRVQGTTGTVSLHYAVEDETTTRGTDYVDTAGTLTFGNGEKTKTITIPLKDDSIGEGAERLRIVLSNPVGANLGDPSAMTVTIMDDESANGTAASSASSSSAASSVTSLGGGPNISFDAQQYSIGENSGTATITVVRNGGSSGQSTVEYETANGSATAGSDYAATKGTITFMAGETQKTFTVPITNNAAIEGMKTVILSLKNPAGASLGAIASAQLAIMDDEIESYEVGSLKFQKKTERVSETAGEVALTILRIGGSKGTVTVDYATRSGLALGGSDYTETNGTLIFLEGEAAKVLRIPIARDTNVLEEDEVFSVNIANTTGGANILDPGTVTVTIVP